MNDPHIDIDEIDNPSEIPPASGDSGTNERPKEPAGGFGFSDLLERMGERANRWQNRFNAGAKLGLDMHIIPPEAKKHMLSSQREFLLAWRALIDHSLEKITKEEEREAAKPQSTAVATEETIKVEKIQVEEF